MLDVSGLVAGYRANSVLHGVSLQIPDGKTIAVVGPNGAGKSTLLKAIMNVVRVTAGTVRFGARDIRGMPTERIARLGIALVPEGRGVFGSLTVAENLRLGLRAAGVAAGDGALSSVLDRFPVLRARLRMSAAGLSGGEQQQLVIARALLTAPRLLILDEPSLGLSPQMVDEIFDVIHGLRADGVTVLLVEQNATRAVDLADHTYVLVSGRIIAEGAKDHLLSGDRLAAAYFGAGPTRSSKESL